MQGPCFLPGGYWSVFRSESGERGFLADWRKTFWCGSRGLRAGGAARYGVLVRSTVQGRMTWGCRGLSKRASSPRSLGAKRVG